MTREDTRKILEKVCRLYITQAKKLSQEEIAMMVDSWEETFRSDSYDDVERAVNNYVRKGNAFIPLPGDIIKEVTAAVSTSAGKGYTESDKLFKTLVNTADMLANEKEHISITDPGGFRWDPETERNVYYHAETVLTKTRFTQYDFAQLPDEIQEYVEDIDGLRNMWPEIASSRALARQRFDRQMPSIKAEIARRKEELVRANENRERILLV